MNQYDFYVQFEGAIPHMYLDTKGNVTCGVGFLLTTLAQARALPWSPSRAVDTDWAELQHLPAGKLASFYGKHMDARLTEDAMRAEFNKRCSEFETQLRRKIPQWLSFPEPVRVALRDMAYNMGAGFFGSPSWPRFTAAVLTRNWLEAAKQCNRKDVQNARNLATIDLFHQAADLERP